MVINYKKIFILLILLFLGFTDVNAGNAYKNELIRVGLTPIGSDDVKITLYMAKPYSEPLRLLKKNDGEFVLILPETYTSAPQKPSISDVIGEVTDADIKLYSFVSDTNQNGYTKIVIKTNGLINLYTEAVTVGGGSLAKAQNRINNLMSDQIKQNSQISQSQNSQNKITSDKISQTKNTQTQVSQTQNIQNKTSQPENSEKKTNENKLSTFANQVKQQIKVPEIKTAKKEDIITDKKIEKKAEVKNSELKKDETKKQEVKLQQKKDEIQQKKEDIQQNETQQVLETQENTEMKNTREEQSASEIKQVTTVVEPVEIEVNQKEPKISFAQKIKNKISMIKEGLLAFAQNAKDIANKLGNILIILISVIVAAFSIKFVISVLKKTNKKQEEIIEPKTEEKKEYSNYFKNIIETEYNKKDDSSHKVLNEKREYNGINIEPSKSHKEIMNEDQNLTWQEKFRALQMNQKSLLQDNTKIFSQKENSRTENTENMNIENPIKKLTQDFRAVRKVLEKHSAAKINNDSIEQNFTPEKIEKIEVISFEDLPKNVQKPKIQVNVTEPIESRPPKILTKLKLGEDKGLYLIDYKSRVSLIGYVKDNVFKLNTYSSVKIPKLYARLTEKNENSNTYIVKVDNSKLLIDVDEEKIKLKLMY